jgi:hypothetical protein
VTKEERHFIHMCAQCGYVHGARIIDASNGKGEEVRSKYSDPTFMKGYQEVIKERLWQTRGGC